MSKFIRTHFTYANVISSLALLFICGGATALAATHLGKNSVGSKQLKTGSVSGAKLRRKAVTTSKIADEAVTGGEGRPRDAGHRAERRSRGHRHQSG